MNASFTTQLRSNRAPVQVASGAGAFTFRVEAAELWDAVRVVALPETPVSEVKQKVMTAMMPNVEFIDEYVLKLQGWEILDHNASLKDLGVREGSILLLADRRRRPVR
jgi:hypothetical protein